MTYSWLKPATWSPKEAFLNLFRRQQHLLYTDDCGVRHDYWLEPVEATKLLNPITVWKGTSWRGVSAALLAYLAAFTETFDFHGLTIQIIKLADFYEVSKSTVSTAVTLMMLFRLCGAIIWGLWADYFGRKWALACNCCFLGFIQVASCYCRNFAAFCAVRALFGIGFGGLFGCASSFAFETIPVNARGLYSGLFTSSYVMSSLLVAGINLAIGGDPSTWPTLFWVGAGLSFATAVLIALYPTEDKYLTARGNAKGRAYKDFKSNLCLMLKKQWPAMLYIIALSAWWNVLAHGAQDSYFTFLVVSKGLNNAQASRNSMYSKLGATLGSITISHLSQTFGRRRAIVLSLIVVCALIPAYVMPVTESGLALGAFCNQFFMTSWGILPIFINEVCHPSFRSTVVGVGYQIGVALSAPTTQIVNILGENNKVIVNSTQPPVQSYGIVIAGVGGLAAGVLILLTAVGPEFRGRHFEAAPCAVETDAVAKAAGVVDITVSNDPLNRTTLSETQPQAVATSTSKDIA